MKLLLAAMAALALATVPAEAQDENCIQRWEAATAAGIVYGVGFVNGQPTVEVDEPTWHTLPYDTRVGIVDTLICAALPAGKTFMSVDLISHLTHKRLGRWSAGRLTVD